MSINGVGNTAVPKTYTRADMAKADAAKANEAQQTETEGSGKVTSKTQQHQKDNAAAIAQVKAEVNQRMDGLRSMVEKMIGQQGKTIGTADGMWSFIAGGNYNVDAKTKADAQQAISDDGYWGVEKTSQRIVDFAKNLTGGDPEKVEEMRAAIEKGFKAATKSWGKALPDISSKTHDAIMKKLDDWASESKNETAPTN